MSQAAHSQQSSGAKYFGKTSHEELRNLERNAAVAKTYQMAKAASYLEEASSGTKTAWFGGWALNLRGSRRETHDLDIVILVSSVVEVRAILAHHNWANLAFYETPGGVQERMFVDIGEEGQVVGVDIVLSGEIGTPDLRLTESFETIRPSFQTPQGDRVNVIHLTWQVEGKLTAWFSRRKNSDLLDLEFLLRTYGDEIVKWSHFLDKNMRETFYEIYDLMAENKTRSEAMKRILSL